MKNALTLAVLVAAFLVACPARAQVSFGDASKFNDGWLFRLTDDSTIVNPTFDDTQWRKLTLPHDWSIEGQLSPSLASCTGYLPGGIGWYRKHFNITDNAARHYIYFEGVYNRSEVYLNGHLLGKRPNGYISFLYDMTPYLKECDNVLSVRVDHSRYADSRWYTGSGIYRDVWLIAAPEIHLAQWGTGWYATSLTDRQATIAVDMEVQKHIATREKLELSATLYDAAGKQVTQRRTRVSDGKEGIIKETLTLKVTKPHRWNLKDPYLYTLKAELLSNGKRIDGCETKVGLRTLDFDPNKGFALNGNWMKVKGVCLHHDAGVLGAVVPPEVWERRLNNLKEIGVNAIRMSHNPQAPVVYNLCDQLGLLVMDEASDEWEFPKRKWIKGWNKGEPGFDGSFDFFEEWIEQDVTDMVRRDRNHPSIFLWSIGNEVDYPNDPYSHPILDGAQINQPMFGGYKPDAPDAMRIGAIAKRLAARVRAVDTSRPVTGALAGVVMSNETEYPDAVDVVGYNYTENRYDEDHATYPKRVIYGSENGSGLDAWYAVKNKEFIFGQFIWTGFDYLGEAGPWPSRGFTTGMIDLAGNIKPNGYFRRALWLESPTVYVGTHKIESAKKKPSANASAVWNYEPGDIIRVVAYTNCEEAELLLNGKKVGERKPYDDSTAIIYWDIPYTPGTLEVVAYNQGNMVAKDKIQSSGLPYAIRASMDKTQDIKVGEVLHLMIQVVDENNIPVVLADNQITCKIEGEADLLGLESGDHNVADNYRDNKQRCKNGKLLGYVKVTGQGKVKIRLTSPLLQPAIWELNVE